MGYCFMVFKNIKLLNYINKKCGFPRLGVMQLSVTVFELKKKNIIVSRNSKER